MKNPIYSISKVVIKKDDRKVLDIKQLDIHRGSCYVIYGDVGSGKTTLLNLLFKKEQISDGSLLYEDTDLDSISKANYNKDIYHVSQELKLPWFKVSVQDYINKKQSLNKFRDLFESIHKKKVVEKKFINNFENKTLFSHEGLINFEESYNPNNPKLLFDYFSNNALILIVIKKPSDLYKSNFIQKFIELKFLNFNDYQNHTDHRKFNI